MDDDLLNALLEAPDDDALRSLVRIHALGVEAVEALKASSARFYFDRPTEALRIAQVARRLGDWLPDPAPALGRWTLANALLFADRYREAIALFEEAGRLYRAAGLPLEAARLDVGHVWALAYTGQFEVALMLASEIEPLLASAAQDNVDDRRRLGGLFNNVGITNELMGRYEEALDAYDRQIVITCDLGDSLELAHVQHNRACALTYLNAFDEALTAFREAESGFRAAGAAADLARLAYNRGTLYAHWGRYAEAEAEFVVAGEWLSASEGTEQARAALAVYCALARLEGGIAPDEVLLGELAAAQACLAAYGPPFEEGLAWLGLGRCRLALGDLAAAQEAFEQVLAIAEGGGGRPLAWEALHYLGNLAERRGDPDTAIAFYEQSIAQVEAIRRDLRLGAFRAGFSADKLAVYHDLALLYARLGRLEDAFAAVERAKSRLLAEQLSERLGDEVAALAASGEPQAQQAAGRLQEVLAQLEQLYRQACLGDDAGERGAPWVTSHDPGTLAAVRQLEDEALDLTRRIAREQPSFSPLMAGHVAPLPDVQDRLHGVLLLQYHVARGRVWAFIVDDAGVRAYRELASLAEVEAARRRFSAAIERSLGLATRYGLETLTRYLPALLADANAQLAALYDLLIRPLAVYLPSWMPLLVSPDGPLHYVPFHALYDGSRYVVEQRTVSYTPSATVLDLCARRSVTGQGMLVVGYGGERLPQVSTEVETLARLFAEADLLSGSAATAGRLLADVSRYRILHLAAHAHFRPDRPLLSSLVLADRRLTLAEIAHLRLGADLVTLSGCETGRGRLYGADLIGLACGFLGAGTRSLLVSLWRVDDATTAWLMDAFYQALRDGKGRAEALRAAQLELLALGRERPGEFGFHRHPAYWAPFVVIGEWGEISESANQRPDTRSRECTEELRGV